MYNILRRGGLKKEAS